MSRYPIHIFAFSLCCQVSIMRFSILMSCIFHLCIHTSFCCSSLRRTTLYILRLLGSRGDASTRARYLCWVPLLPNRVLYFFCSPLLPLRLLASPALPSSRLGVAGRPLSLGVWVGPFLFRVMLRLLTVHRYRYTTSGLSETLGPCGSSHCVVCN